MQVLLRLDKVCLRFGRRQVLKDIDWTIRKNESWAIAGASGSGKACLTKILSGELRPASGELIERGEKCAAASVRRQKYIRLGFGGEEKARIRGSASGSFAAQVF
ncbi:MAG TPA: ATP-binding cassette domain-containing protein [Oligoflexia bacterium]|nr:ATP-binding cassette domain-containing protein [Oligoflexia bacterium]